MHELPANKQAIAIIGEADHIDNAYQFLISKKYFVINQFKFTDEIYRSAKEFNLLESGNHSIQLWQANPLLQEATQLIDNAITGRTLIDIACGAGRDSVYMAQNGWNVTAIDYKRDALDRAVNLAKINGVSIDTKMIDLESSDNAFEDSNIGSADLVMVMRYLHRPLFPTIDHLIKPGGAIFYSTFMVGSEQFGSPKNPNFLLKDGELADLFSSFNTTYEILIDEKRSLPDGRPVTYFLAQKTKGVR